MAIIEAIVWNSGLIVGFVLMFIHNRRKQTFEHEERMKELENETPDRVVTVVNGKIV